MWWELCGATVPIPAAPESRRGDSYDGARGAAGVPVCELVNILQQLLTIRNTGPMINNQLLTCGLPT